MRVAVELNCFDASNNLFLNKNIRTYLAPNFTAMINELIESHKMTAEKIAFLVAVSCTSTVRGWIKGVTPNYDNGNAIVELWVSITNKTVSEVPRLNRYLVNN